MRKLAIVFAAGFVSVFVLKYAIVGLRKWNELLHEERIEVDAKGPLKDFSEPLLQGLWR